MTAPAPAGQPTGTAHIRPASPRACGGGSFLLTLTSLERARNERGPMTARHLSYTIAGLTGRPDLGDALRAAIRSNAHVFLNPPIANLGHRGIGKAARQVPRWLDRSSDPSHDLPLAAALMNAAGPAARCSAPCTAPSWPNAPPWSTTTTCASVTSCTPRSPRYGPRWPTTSRPTPRHAGPGRHSHRLTPHRSRLNPLERREIRRLWRWRPAGAHRRKEPAHDHEHADQGTSAGLAFCGWMVSCRASMATNSAIFRSRVSARLTELTR